MAAGWRGLAATAGWVLLPLAVGGLSGIATAGSVDTWYQTLEKPVFNPPAWVFGPVWTALYLMMGAAMALVWRAGRADSGSSGGSGSGSGGNAGLLRRAVVAFLVQLTLNGLWSILFFGLRRPGFALVEIVFLWAAIGITFVAFRRLSKPAAWLLAPYWAWVSFAAVLNAAIWWLNR